MTRICYITPNAPLPADRGGRVRSHHLWRALAALAEVKVFVLGDKPPRTEREMLFASGSYLMPRRLLKMSRFGRAGDFREGIDPPGLWEAGGQLGAWGGDERFWHGLSRADAFHRHHLNERRIARILRRVQSWGAVTVVLDDTGMAPLIPALKGAGLKVVISPENLDSRLWLDIADNATDPAYRRWAQLVARGFGFMERTYLAMADQVWACSAIDAARLQDELGLPDVRVVPNAIDVLAPPAPATGRDLVYVAQMGYRPNEDAALRLIEMSRRFVARRVEHTLHLVGRPTEAVRRAAEGQPHVKVHGVVPSTAPFLALAAVVPVTLRVGGGTRIKIIEAMASARPVVSTAIGIEGIAATSGEDCLIVDDEHGFDAAVQRLLDDPEEAARIGRNGHALAHRHYSQVAVTRLVADHLRAMDVAVDAAAGRRAPPQATVLTSVGRFNPVTRLLQLRLGVRAAHPLEEAEVELAAGEDRALYNSAATIGQGAGAGRPLQYIDITAVLPPGITTADLIVRAHAYGEQVLEACCDCATLTEETTGLMTAALRPDGTLTGSLWASADAGMPRVTFDRRQPGRVEPPLPLVQRPSLVTADLEVNVGSALDKVRPLVVQPDFPSTADAGQTFWLIEPFTRDKTPSSRRLAGMKDMHAGETAWLIGNGPSVRTEDLQRLRGKLSFAFNRFHLAHEQTDFRPTYTVSADRQMIEDFGQEIVDQSGGTVFLSDDRCPPMVGDFVWLRQIALWPPLFSTTPGLWVSPGGSSLYVAMQLAHHMGIRRFYVYGADFKFVYRREAQADNFRVASGDDNHFIKNYRNNKPWCPPSFVNICPAFHTARVLMERDGGWIRNATRGGLLEMFERQDFDIAAAE